MSDAIWLYHSKPKVAVLDCVKDLYDRVIKPRRIAHDMKLFIIPADNEDVVSYNAMLTKVKAVDLLHRTLGHVAEQRIEDAINTGHVEWCHE